MKLFLAVIAIIGILAGIVLVSLGGARASARDAKRQADIRQIATAMELYYNDNSAYVAGSAMPTTIGTTLTHVPFDPKTQAAYGWVNNTADSQDFCVLAQLEKVPAGAENNVFFAAGPTGFREREVPIAFTLALTDCE